MALHIFAIVCSITEILLDLDQLNHVYQTDDYGEYFKLTYFDRGRSLEYIQTVVECHPLD